MISGDGVTEVEKAVGRADIFNGLQFGFSRREERGVGNVGGRFVPIIKFAGGSFEALPHFGSLEDGVVSLLEHFRLNTVSGNFRDFFTRRPDVCQEHVVSLLILTERSSFEVEVNRASKSIGNDKRRRSEVVGASVGVDSALEISVS